MNIVLRFLNNESGATAVEYGLIAAGIAIAIVSILPSIGGHLLTKFTAVDDALK